MPTIKDITLRIGVKEDGSVSFTLKGLEGKIDAIGTKGKSVGDVVSAAANKIANAWENSGKGVDVLAGALGKIERTIGGALGGISAQITEMNDSMVGSLGEISTILAGTAEAFAGLGEASAVSAAKVSGAEQVKIEKIRATSVAALAAAQEQVAAWEAASEAGEQNARVMEANAAIAESASKTAIAASREKIAETRLEIVAEEEKLAAIQQTTVEIASQAGIVVAAYSAQGEAATAAARTATAQAKQYVADTALVIASINAQTAATASAAKVTISNNQVIINAAKTAAAAQIAASQAAVAASNATAQSYKTQQAALATLTAAINAQAAASRQAAAAANAAARAAAGGAGGGGGAGAAFAAAGGGFGGGLAALASAAGNLLSNVARQIRNVFAVAFAFEIIRAIGQIENNFGRLIALGVEFNVKMQQGALAIAAIIVSTRALEDAQGNVIATAAIFPVVLLAAKQLQEQLLFASVHTLGTYEDLAGVYQEVLGFTAKQKATDTERLTLAENIVNFGRLLGLTGQRLVDESRQILLLETQRGQQILQALGYTAQQLRHYKEQHTLVQVLNNALKDVNAISQTIGQTLQGMATSVQSLIGALDAKAFEGVFGGLLVVLQNVRDTLLAAFKSGTIFVGLEATTEQLRVLGTTIGEFLISAIKSAAEFTATITDFLAKNNDVLLAGRDIVLSFFTLISPLTVLVGKFISLAASLLEVAFDVPRAFEAASTLKLPPITTTIEIKNFGDVLKQFDEANTKIKELEDAQKRLSDQSVGGVGAFWQLINDKIESAIGFAQDFYAGWVTLGKALREITTSFDQILNIIIRAGAAATILWGVFQLLAPSVAAVATGAGLAAAGGVIAGIAAIPFAPILAIAAALGVLYYAIKNFANISKEDNITPFLDQITQLDTRISSAVSGLDAAFAKGKGSEEVRNRIKDIADLSAEVAKLKQEIAQVPEAFQQGFASKLKADEEALAGAGKVIVDRMQGKVPDAESQKILAKIEQATVAALQAQKAYQEEIEKFSNNALPAYRSEMALLEGQLHKNIVSSEGNAKAIAQYERAFSFAAALEQLKLLEKQFNDLQRVTELNIGVIERFATLAQGVGAIKLAGAGVQVQNIQTDLDLAKAQNLSLATQIELTQRLGDAQLAQAQLALQLDKDQLQNLINIQAERQRATSAAEVAAAKAIVASPGKSSPEVLVTAEQLNTAQKSLADATKTVDELQAKIVTGEGSIRKIILDTSESMRELTTTTVHVGDAILSSLQTSYTALQNGTLKFKDFFKSLATGIQGAFATGFFQSIKEKFKFDVVFKNNMLGTGGDGIIGIVKSAAAGISTSFAGAFGDSSKSAQQFTTSTTSLFSGLLDSLTSGFENLLSFLSTGISKIISLFSSIGSGGGGGGIGGFISSILGGIKNLFGAGSSAGGGSGGILNTIVGGIKGLFGANGFATQSVATGAVDAAKTVWTAGQDLSGTGTGAVVGSGGGLGGIGAGIGAGLAGNSTGSFLSSLFGLGKSSESRTGGNVGGAVGGIAGYIFGGPIGSFIGSTLGNLIGSFLGSLFEHIPTKGTQIRQGVVKWLKDIGSTFAGQIDANTYGFEWTKAYAKKTGESFLDASQKFIPENFGDLLKNKVNKQLLAIGVAVTSEQADKLGKSLDQTAVTFANMIAANLQSTDKVTAFIADTIQKGNLNFGGMVDVIAGEFNKGKISITTFNDAIEGTVKLFNADLAGAIDVAALALDSFNGKSFDTEKFKSLLASSIAYLQLQGKAVATALSGLTLSSTPKGIVDSYKVQVQTAMRDAVVNGFIAGFLNTQKVGVVIATAMKKITDIVQQYMDGTIDLSGFHDKMLLAVKDLQPEFDKIAKALGVGGEVLLDLLKKAGLLADGVAATVNTIGTDLVKASHDLLLNDKLSPLTPNQRLQTQGNDFLKDRLLALGGDETAAKRLQAEGEAFLTSARDKYKSSAAYEVIFDFVRKTFLDVASKFSTPDEIAHRDAIDQLLTLKEIRDYIKKIGHFAQGGIVTQPTLAMVGEAGPEAIVPLSQMMVTNPANIPMLADGGMVTHPTLAMIGESGPEMVIPLAKMQSIPKLADGGVVQKATIALLGERGPEAVVPIDSFYHDYTAMMEHSFKQNSANGGLGLGAGAGVGLGSGIADQGNIQNLRNIQQTNNSLVAAPGMKDILDELHYLRQEMQMMREAMAQQKFIAEANLTTQLVLGRDQYTTSLKKEIQFMLSNNQLDIPKKSVK